MKKLILLVALLTPCVPSLVAGIQSQRDHNRERKLQMLEPRFEKWCLANGISYYNLSTKELDVIWDDQWSESDDFQCAIDSVDSILRVENNVLTTK